MECFLSYKFTLVLTELYFFKVYFSVYFSFSLLLLLISACISWLLICDLFMFKNRRLNGLQVVGLTCEQVCQNLNTDFKLVGVYLPPARKEVFASGSNIHTQVHWWLHSQSLWVIAGQVILCGGQARIAEGCSPSSLLQGQTSLLPLLPGSFLFPPLCHILFALLFLGSLEAAPGLVPLLVGALTLLHW